MLLRIWKLMLIEGEVPRRIARLYICLIPKRAGGTRPIALIASCIRVMNRWLRRSYGEQWRRRNNRDYIHGNKEASCAALPWKLAAAAEMAKAQGLTAMSVMLDLEKAFE